MRMRRTGILLLVVVALVAGACSGDDGSDTGSQASSGEYRATIRRTSYGIPHVTAADLGSVAFGQGYAFAEDHACTLADQVIRVRSERAKYLGPGDDDANVNSDFALAALGVYDGAEALLPELSDGARDVVEGYTAGYNAYLAETGADDVHGWCAGEPWVMPITTVDLLAHLRELALLASGRQLVDLIATAQPPEGTVPEPSPSTTEAAFGELGAASAVASNGWAIGAERAAERGLLLANPHFPWEGELRLWEVQLTVPGELDVYGATLLGVPGVLIGFNDAVAWTHTVSAGNRFTVYRLDLVEGDPTSYLYDGEPRAMDSEELTIEVAAADGTVEEQSRTMWRSHYGPILNFPGLGWSEETTLTYRDANVDDDVLLDQFLGMDAAGSLEEFQRVHEEVNGIPWVNTIAVSGEGEAWYADTASTPNLSDDAIQRWLASLESDPIASIAYDNGAVLLDGSDSSFEWVDADGARSPGLVPFSDQPKLERDDYVFNANDSHWLANPQRLLTGYSPLHGREETARTPRTRMNVVALEEGGGDDGRFTLDELQEAALSNRALTAELLKDAVVADVCPGQPDLTDACAVLEAWDGRFDVDSRGAALWRLFIAAYDFSDLLDAGPLFSERFDATDPVRTPSGSAFGDPANAELALTALRGAVADLAAAGFSVDTPYGEVFFAPRAGERIPMHGGPGDRLGITNAVDFSVFTTSSEPGYERQAAVRDGSSLTTEGWPVTYGTSFIMALEFTDDGPHAQAFLTYGETGDDTSPHFADQTRLFSEKAWRDILFTDDEIAADPELREYEVTGTRNAT
jgi:acyl-homoserine-lactone acylase